MAKSCPGCGGPATGNFCSDCGTPLDRPSDCGACGNRLPEGARFCNMCGQPTDATPPSPAVPTSGAKENAAAAGSPAGRVGWIAAGVAIAALLLVLLVPRLNPPSPAAPTPAPTQALDPTGVDLSSMTPREAADRLFNRVMENVSSGDSAQARAFAPIALAAYERVTELDLDGRYHVAVLHLVDQDPESALQVASAMLDEVPTHLFALHTAAQASDLLDDSAAANDFYRQFLDSYDAEVATDRPEYADHAALLPLMHAEADARLE